MSGLRLYTYSRERYILDYIVCVQYGYECLSHVYRLEHLKRLI